MVNLHGQLDLIIPVTGLRVFPEVLLRRKDPNGPILHAGPKMTRKEKASGPECSFL